VEFYPGREVDETELSLEHVAEVRALAAVVVGAEVRTGGNAFEVCGVLVVAFWSG
jgi:hypothetical protein